MRRSVVALHVLIVGLALHNVVMALLWRAGVRGGALTAVSAWKDVLLLVALVLVVRGTAAAAVRRSPHGLARTRIRCARRALRADAAVVARRRRRRTRASPTQPGTTCCRSAAYFLGRGLHLTDRERSRLCHTVLATAAFVAAFGLVDVYAVPLSFWRPVAGWFHDQLGLRYTGLSGLPENFVYNAGQRRRLPASHLDVPLAARDVVPARRRALLHSAAAPVGPAARPADLRRAPVDAHALRADRARRRARVARDRPPARAPPDLGRRSWR